MLKLSLSFSLCLSLSLYEGNPPSLQNLCRIYIRHQVGTKKLVTDEWVDRLPIPPPLKDVLLYKDVRVDNDDDDVDDKGDGV